MSLTRPRAHQLLDIDFKQSARVVTISNVNLNGGAPLTVDDVTLAKGDRVLVTGQNTPSQNGIYKVTVPGSGSNGTWIRSADANASGDMTAGLFITVTEGTTYADTRWKLSTPDPIVLGSTGLTFSLQSTSTGNNSFGNITIGATSVLADQVGDSVTFAAGNNMVISGNVITDSVTFAVSDNPSISGNLSVTGNLTITGNTSVSTLTSSSTTSLGLTSATAINSTPIGNATPSTGAFTTLSSNSTTTLGLTSATAINSTPIGNASASSGMFTSLQATGVVTLSPENSAVSISPTGTGTVTIAPNTQGSINKMVIGNVTAAAGTFTTLTSTSTTSLGATSATAINSTPIGNATPSTGAFTTLSSNSTTSLGATSATAINSTPIGNATPSTGAFTTLTSNNSTTFTSSTASTSSSTGAVVVTGGTGVGGNIFAGGLITATNGLQNTPVGNATASSGAFTTLTANGSTTFTASTASSSTSTGAIVVTGGVGVGGNAYVGGNLVVTGNLTINGTTTTINSTTTTVDDPIFTLGGDTAPSSDDNKDRGIEFRWHNGSAAKVGFFGYDDSAGRFTFIPDATNTSEVFSGTAGDCTFGTVYATATSAQYADLAEYYLADAAYEPGTVVVLGGEKEITESRIHADRRIAGIISTQPAYIMNDSLKGIGLPVALTGRVPCKVKGYAHKGDLIVSSSTPGVAVAWGDFENPPTGAVIGKCLVNKQTAEVELVEVLVGRT